MCLTCPPPNRPKTSYGSALGRWQKPFYGPYCTFAVLSYKHDTSSRRFFQMPRKRLVKNRYCVNKFGLSDSSNTFTKGTPLIIGCMPRDTEPMYCCRFAKLSTKWCINICHMGNILYLCIVKIATSAHTLTGSTRGMYG